VNILFVCVHNSGRSQMAEAFAKCMVGNALEVASAGTVPGGEMDPTVVAAMAERGIDISGAHPKLIEQAMVDTADLVFTMGCAIDESCPAAFIPSDDWGLDDPARQPIEVVRQIRDEVEAKVRALLQQVQK
jgi:protein-tyrosine-phosphatase